MIHVTCDCSRGILYTLCICKAGRELLRNQQHSLVRKSSRKQMSFKSGFEKSESRWQRVPSQVRGSAGE